MRKRLNRKTNKNKIKFIKVIIMSIFIIYVSLCLALSNRKYFYIENFFKNISSKINSLFINNLYSTSSFSDNVISNKTESLKKENNELRKQLDLKIKNENYIISEIINHAYEFWFNKIELNKGSKQGIKINMPVLNSEGLIGFISKSSKNISEVKLITGVNEENMLSVIIETSNTNIAGVLSDYDSKKGLFKITEVMSKEPIMAGDRVVLSGYDNQSYKGIYVGRVVKEEISNYGLSRTIWIESAVNFDDLLLVAVVKEQK